MSRRQFLPSSIPLIQAPMAGAQGPALAIAVCEAGGLGSLPCAMITATQLRDQAAQVRAATNAPFNLNFFCHRPSARDDAAETAWRTALGAYFAEKNIDPQAIPQGGARNPFDADYCAAVEDVRPAVVSFHFGLPERALLERVKKAGALVLSSATTVEEARWLEEHGADVIIAQGNEAGGHRAMFLTADTDAQPGLFALLPQIRDAVRVPVVAAGGIADARGIRAAFALGADAVQIGTAYLRTPQATITPFHRAALARARDDGTRLTNLFTGRPARGILNRFMREQGPISDTAPAFPTAGAAVAPLRAAAEKEGSDDFTPMWAGEAAALTREADAGQLTRDLWTMAEKG